MIRRYRKRRFYLFFTLIICVISMSIGFSAFSSELSISSSAIVRPDSGSFKVLFSSSGTEYLTDKINGVVVDGDASGGQATIDNTGDSSKISDLTATFTDQNQSVKYEFYAYNAGAYNAYLTDIIFKNVSGEGSNKLCTAIGSASEALVQDACNDINVSVDVESNISVMGSTNGIKNHILAKGTYEKVVVTISYASGDNLADGDFRVEFGDIELTYSSVNPDSSIN